MTEFVALLLVAPQWRPDGREGGEMMTEIDALRAIMTEIEALRQILKSEKPELADAPP